MPENSSDIPSVQAMGVRITKNLEQVQGYLDVLIAEIDDPLKLGPGTSRKEWNRLSLELGSYLGQLKNLLKSALDDHPDE